MIRCCNIATCKPGSAKVTMTANQALLRGIAHAFVDSTERVVRADGVASTSIQREWNPNSRPKVAVRINFFFANGRLTQKRRSKNAAASVLSWGTVGGSGDVKNFYSFFRQFVIYEQVSDAAWSMIVAVVRVPQRKTSGIACCQHHHFLF